MIRCRVLPSHSQLARWVFRRHRSGEADSKSTVLIIVAILGGLVLLGACVIVPILVALLLPAVQQAREAARRTQSKNNLKMIGLAMHNYHDVFQQFPPSGIYGEDGTAYHGWQTMLLPYVDQAPLYNQINMNLPWTDPVNDRLFRTALPVYLNPSETEQLTSAGYGASHYAGNQLVLRPNGNHKIADTKDGTANTILAGEVPPPFAAWGDPANVRDPSAGIGTGPAQFGRSGNAGGCHFLLMDGSVRFVSENIDRDVLKALSTPDGGEQIGAF
jgi:type II secretory pathway pseudopilin PulG